MYSSLGVMLTSQYKCFQIRKPAASNHSLETVSNGSRSFRTAVQRQKRCSWSTDAPIGSGPDSHLSKKLRDQSSQKRDTKKRSLEFALSGGKTVFQEEPKTRQHGKVHGRRVGTHSRMTGTISGGSLPFFGASAVWCSVTSVIFGLVRNFVVSKFR